MFTFNTLKDLIPYIQESKNNVKFLNYLKNGKWHNISKDEFVQTVYKLSHAFSKAGVKKGTSVAIVSDSSPFWLMIDYALLDIGAISVPIFANISHENFVYELEDAQVEYIYIASQEKYDQTKESIDLMRLIITHDVYCANINSVDFDTFIEIDAQKSLNDVEPNDLATIIYTSGSMGVPKGVELTHKNITTQLKDTSKVFALLEDDVALSFLPLAHIFERMVMSYYLASGISIYFVDDVKNISKFIKDVNPSIMTVVPRLLDKIYIKMHDSVKALSFIKKIIASLALSEADNKDVHKRTVFTPIFEKLVYSKLLEALGKDMRMMICGGAHLSKQSERFFTNIGLNIYQGYGLTETSPVICANSPKYKKPFTCGKAFDNSEIKLASDGELLTRGASLMKGYHNKKEETFKSMDYDGWFHTGDLASVDEDGYVTINGRKKELFKTSTGKYISALHIEQLLTQNRWCDYAVVIAENRPYVTALIFLDAPIIEEYAKKKRLIYENIIDTYHSKAIKGLVKKIVDKANKHLNYEERIKKFYIVQDEATIKNHILTPSMKIAKYVVYKKYEDIINSLYGEIL